VSTTNSHLSFNSGIEGVLSNNFRPDEPNFIPVDRQMRLEGGRVYRHVDHTLALNLLPEIMLEFARPKITSTVTLPNAFIQTLIGVRMKLSNQRNRMRDVRKRAIVTRVLQVLEELDDNMSKFLRNISSLRKA